MDYIKIQGLSENNLKHISLTVPKNKITVFTGVSGSGKSSIVFDTIAAEAKRQMNETYPAFVRSRMPKYEKPQVELIENLSPVIIVDQSALSGNMRSTVGTISELYTALRLLYSRIGQPYVGPASAFSFNDVSGMCPVCSGMGKVTDIDIDSVLDKERSLAQGAITDSMFKVGAWYYKLYANSGFFNLDKPLKEYSETEMNLLLYGAKVKDGKQENEQVEGIYNCLKRRWLTRDLSVLKSTQQNKSKQLITEKQCPSCQGKRLNRTSLGCWIQGYNIAELCAMELTDLREVLQSIDDARVQTIVDTLVAGLSRMIDIDLPYLSLDRQTPTLSGGEAQRLKLVRYLGSSLTGMMYVFDEPSTGMHPRDVGRMNQLLIQLRDKGNTVLVVEHDKDVIKIADEVIDVGPLAGKEGGRIVFQGSYEALLQCDTLTGKALRASLPLKANPRTPKEFLPIRNAHTHNLKGLNVDIPLGVICVITGVAGSGKSSLISNVFANQYQDRVIRIDQSPITATNRSTPSSFLGFLDEIRRLLAEENQVSASLFSFNSDGACPHCQGKGEIVTELVYMDPITTVCEVCHGARFSELALSYRYHGLNILEVLALTATEAMVFFAHQTKILKPIKALCEVGLAYMTLGQPLSTLSGGERQRLKLAKNLYKKGNIYILDEPTTGLHPSDCTKLMILFEQLVQKENSVLIIEHNLEVMKQADYLIDIGPDGGKNGGEVVFCGTPKEMVRDADTITARYLKADVLHEPVKTEEVVWNIRKEEEQDMMKLQPIGRVVNKEGYYGILLDPRYREALTGLNGFSHLQVFWWFDGCDTVQDRSVLTEKKPYTNGPDTVGIFATRSPQRPNPLAISTVGILHIEEEKAYIEVDYIDALDGTPVLDLKPYTPSADRVEHPSVPDWCAHWPKNTESSGEFDWEKEFNFK